MPRTVLVADDEPSILETTRFILESEGFHVLVARDGEEALAVLERERPRAVLLDVMMPKLNGYDVCRRIRADARLRDTYVLIVTAKGQAADERMAIEAGADAYIRKPFDDEDVVRRLDEVFAAP